GGRDKGTNLRATLAELEPGERRERMQHEATASLARILDVPPEKLDASASIDSFGLDSLMLTQLRNWVLRALDINWPMIKLLKGPSMEILSAELLAALDNSGPVSAVAKDASL